MVLISNSLSTIIFIFIINVSITDLLDSEKSPNQSNDILRHSVEFSNVHNCDRSSNATRSNIECTIILK